MIRLLAPSVRFTALLIGLMAGLSADLRATESLSLWPEKTGPVTSASRGEALPSRNDQVLRISRIDHPELLVFHAADTSAPVPAVLVCPGGGYKHLALNIEGTRVAKWLNSLKMTAVVLKYRVPGKREEAFQDAQRAMSLIRRNAARWNIDPGRVGILGFSAGGHLAARVSTGFAKRSYPAVDEADTLSCRPDFAVLIYPAYLADQDLKLSHEIAVTTGTPPTFLVQTSDDRKHVFSSLAYAAALQGAGVAVEFHLFTRGGHGYGLGRSGTEVAAWPRLCERWLQPIIPAVSRSAPPADPGAAAAP